MANLLPQRSLRLLPRNDFSKLTGSRGEIFYDSVNNTLRVFNGQSQGGEILASRSWVATQLPSVAGLATETYVNQTVAAIPQYLLKIAADDSTVLAVGRDETLQVRGTGFITATIDTDSTGIQLVVDGSNLFNQVIGNFATIGMLDNLQENTAPLGLVESIVNNLQNTFLYALTPLSLQLPDGVGIGEFTNDPAFTDNSPSSVPTEAAVRSYIDRRLGLTHNGSVVNPVNKIGPTYVTAGVLGGHTVSMHCERNGVGAIGQIMSFGNGSSAGKGLRMPANGRLIAATLAGTGINGTVTVQAYLNGTANASYQLTQTNDGAADVGVTQNFSSSPLLFNGGDTLGWYQASLPTAASVFNVNFYVVFD